MSKPVVYDFPWGQRIITDGEVREIRYTDHGTPEPVPEPVAEPEPAETIVNPGVRVPRDTEPWWTGTGATRVARTL